MKLTYYGNGSQTEFSTPNSVGYGAVVYSSNPAYVPVIASQSTTSVTLTVAPPLNTKIKILYDDTPTEYVSGTVEWRKNSAGVLDAIQKPDGSIFDLPISVKALGAKGDGVTDDTARIQDA
jgi:polygalacturonase